MPNSKKTVLRFLFPFIATGWGIAYLLPGDNIYNSAPQLYEEMRKIPEVVWGSVSVTVGVLAGYSEIFAKDWVKIVCAFIHAIMLWFIAFQFVRHSPLGAFWFGTLGLFQMLHMGQMLLAKSGE